MLARCPLPNKLEHAKTATELVLKGTDVTHIGSDKSVLGRDNDPYKIGFNQCTVIMEVTAKGN